PPVGGRPPRRPRRIEDQDVHLADVAPDGEDLVDLPLQERGVLELVAVADGRGDLAGEGDGPLAQVLLDPAPGEAQAERGEPERDDDEDGDAQEDELEPDAGAHDPLRTPAARAGALSRGGRSPGSARRRAR